MRHRRIRRLWALFVLFVFLQATAMAQRRPGAPEPAEDPVELREKCRSTLERDPENLEVRTELAKSYLSGGMLEEAGKEIEILLGQAPLDLEARTLSRRLHIALGDREAAIEDLKEEIDECRDPLESARRLYILGNLLELEGKEAEAEKAWMRILETGHGRSYRILMRFFVSMGRDDLAAKVYEKGIEAGIDIRPEGDRFLDFGARLAVATGDIDEAIARMVAIQRIKPEYFESYIHPLARGRDTLRWTLDADDLLVPLRRLAEEEKEDPDGWFLLAAFAHGGLRYAATLEALEGALAAKPDCREILEMIVRHCDSTGMVQEGIPYAEKLLVAVSSPEAADEGKQPGWPRRPGRRPRVRPGEENPLQSRGGVLAILGRFHRMAGDPEKAKEAIRRIGEAGDALSHSRMTEVLEENGFLIEAADAMEKYMEGRDRVRWEDRLRLVKYRALAGQEEEARALLDEMLAGADEEDRPSIVDWRARLDPPRPRESRSPEDLEAELAPDSTDYIALLRLGQAFLARGVVEKAEVYLERAAKADPTQGEPLLALLKLHRREAEWPRAITDLERIIDRFPEEVGKLGRDLGDLYVHVGDTEKALEVWKRAQPGARADQLHYQLGQRLAAKGLHEEAAEAYREAIRLAGPTSPMTEQYERILEAALPPSDPRMAMERHLEDFLEGMKWSARPGAEEGLRYFSRKDEIRILIDSIRSTPAAERSVEDERLLWVAALFGDDLEEAREVIRSHLERAPGDREAWYGLHTACVWSGDTEGALEACKGWLDAEARGEGRISPILRRMAGASSRLGMKADAIRYSLRSAGLHTFPLYEYTTSLPSRGVGLRTEDHIRRLIGWGYLDEALREIERSLPLGGIWPDGALSLAATVHAGRGEADGARALAVEAVVCSEITGGFGIRLLGHPEPFRAALPEMAHHLRHRRDDRALLDRFLEEAIQQGQPEAAIPHLRSAVVRSPSDLFLRLELARGLVEAEICDEALPLLEGIRRVLVLRGGRQSHEHVVRHRPGSGSGSRIGRTVEEEHLMELLRTAYSALGMEEEVEALEIPQRGEGSIDPGQALCGRAFELKRKGKLEEALAAAGKGLEALGNSLVHVLTRTTYEVGLREMELTLLRKLGRMDEAAVRARELVALHEERLVREPWFAHTHVEIAEIHSAYTRDWEAAISAAETARSYLPYAPWTAEHLGWVYLRKGDPAKAGALFEEAEELHRRAVHQPGGSILFGRALVAHREGRPEEARDLLARTQAIVDIDVRDFYQGEFADEIDAIRSGPE